MKPGRYSEEHIVKILHEGGSEIKIADLCRSSFGDRTPEEFKIQELARIRC